MHCQTQATSFLKNIGIQKIAVDKKVALQETGNMEAMDIVNIHECLNTEQHVSK